MSNKAARGASGTVAGIYIISKREIDLYISYLKLPLTFHAQPSICIFSDFY